MREMRRNDRQIRHEEAVAILKKGEFGVFTTTGDQGYPYGVPVSYAYDGDAIYFHSAKEGHKLDAVRANPKCSFTVVGDTELLPGKFSTNYESAIAFGHAEEVEGEEKQRALMALIGKYSGDFMDKGQKYVGHSGKDTVVIKIAIDHLTGKARR